MWKVEYYSGKVEQEVLGLPDGLLAQYLRLVDRLIVFGSNLGLPHTRAMGNGLFELRVKGKGKRRDCAGVLLYPGWA